MAVFYSTEYDNLHVAPLVRTQASKVYGSGFTLPFNFTNPASGGAATIGDLIYLVKVPSMCEIVMPKSYFKFSAWSASTTIDIGWLAYTGANEAGVAADDNGLLDGLDVDAAGWWECHTTHTSTATIVHNSAIVDIYSVRASGPVTLTAVFRDTAPLASATFSGHFAVLVD